ncbi:MAG: TRAP transporter permease [Sedimentibacter sp.]
MENNLIDEKERVKEELEKQTEVLEKYEKESRTRKVSNEKIAKALYWLGLSIALYHFITAYVGYPTILKHRSLHVAMMLFMSFLLYPASNKSSRKKIPWFDVIFAIISIVVAVYVWVDYENLINRMGMPNTYDIIIGTALIVLVMEASRRTSDMSLVLLNLSFIAYGLWGSNLPGMFAHRGYNWAKLVNHIFINTEGIYGSSVAVAASYIFLFILFGAVMNKCGMGQFFNDIALALAGHTKGGPAKVAVIASGLLGSINGSAVANVVTTGSFTIPLMTNVGFTKEYAGAVVSSASIGGQLLPPVMGAAAFIMAEMIGVSYGTVAASAAIPALLYYFGILVQVQLRAEKENMQGIPKDQLPKVKDVMRLRGHLIIPIAFLVYMLIFSGKTVIYSAFITIILTIVVSWFKKETRMSVRDVIDAFEESTRQTVSVAVACAVVGIMIGIVSLTGFGLNMANAIIQLGQSSLMATLVLTMLTCLILGIGLPSIPSYLITATIGATALVKLGIPEMAAHLFSFYYAMFANLTPPVALVAFAAAGIAGGDANKTGWIGCKLSLGGYIIPFIFIYNTSLLLIDVTAIDVIRTLIASLVGVFIMSVGIEGYLYTKVNAAIRILSIIGGIMLITSNIYFNLIGLLALVVLLVVQKAKVKKEEVMITNS